MDKVLLYIIIGVVLPIIPTLLIYKIIPPKETIVKGPFKGMTVQLTGAFAAYFLLFIIVEAYFLHALQSSVFNSYEMWKVSGTVAFAGAPPAFNRNNIVITENPPIKPNPDGTFDMYVVVKKNNSGELEFPTLAFDHPNFFPATVHLDEKQFPNCKIYMKEYDKKSKSILIRELVKLERQAVGYANNGQIPQPSM